VIKRSSINRPSLLRGVLSRTGCHVLLPLLVGASIYTLWRSRHLLVFGWYRATGLGHLVEYVRHVAYPFRSAVPQVILYSLPDALWVYSFTAALALIWRFESKSLPRLIWLLIPSVLAVGAEFGQALHLVPGTFDLSDIISYIIAGVLGSILPNIDIRHAPEQTNGA
jgi:hypothetical protein